MTERPIIFSAALVRAVLDGRKTQTRRVVRPQPHPTCSGGGVGWHWHPRGKADHFLWNDDPDGLGRQMAEWCPYGGPGDRLWVREAFRPLLLISGKHRGMDQRGIEYRASPGDVRWADGPGRFARRVSRLAAPGGRVLDDDYDAAAETPWRPSIHMPRWASRVTLEIAAVRAERVRAITEADARAEGAGSAADFARLWDELNGKRPGCGWDADPWVWVLTFRRAEP